MLGALGAAILVVLAFLSGPQYATNDDMGLLWALNGGDGFPSHAFAPFNGHVLNGFLFRLYLVVPGVPWWGLLIYAASTTGAWLILSALFRRGRFAWVVLPAVAWFLWLCLVRPGITSATLLLSVGALLGLASRTLAPSMPHDRTPWIGLTFCLTASLLMRWQLAASFLIFTVPLIVMSSGVARRRVILVLLAAVAVLAADRLAFTVFTAPGERAFLHDNALRARFHDTPEGLRHGAVTVHALDKAGWTGDDYAFFRAWNIQDDSLFNAHRLEIFLTENAVRAGSVRNLATRLAAVVGDAQKNLLVFVLALLALASWVTGRRGHRGGPTPIPRWQKLIPWFLPISSGAAILYFAQVRFVERVYLPLFLLTLVSMALVHAKPFPYGDSRERSRGQGFIPALILLLVQSAAVLYFSLGHWRALQKDTGDERFAATCLERRVNETGGAPMAYLDPASGLGIENIHPLRESFNVSQTPRIVPGGFWIGSPRWRLSLQTMGAENGRGFLRQSVGAELDWVLLNDRTAARPILDAWEGYYRRNLDIAMQLVPASSCRDAGGRELTFYRML